MRFKYLLIILWIQFLCSVGFALCVKTSKANLRTGPGSHFAKSWVVGRYTPLVFQKAQGPWYQVKDQDGELHWIHRNMVTRSFKCLSVKTKIANLRTGSGSSFPLDKYRAAEKYETFIRLKKNENWYFVENNFGKKFWIHKSNVWIPRKNISIHF